MLPNCTTQSSFTIIKIESVFHLNNQLYIETNEFNIGYRISPQNKTHEIYIVETAENGAGYCNYLNGLEDKEISQKVFIQNFIKGEKIYDELFKVNHKDCMSSCYDCLRDYFNQHEHNLLNWRMALDLARISNNKNELLDFSQEYWDKFFKEYLTTLIDNKDNSKLINKNGRYFIVNKNKDIFLITHPFWSVDYINTLISESDCSDSIDINEVI